jgi:hypothetical protein
MVGDRYYQPAERLLMKHGHKADWLRQRMAPTIIMEN